MIGRRKLLGLSMGAGVVGLSHAALAKQPVVSDYLYNDVRSDYLYNDTRNVMDFGAVGDNKTDDTAAIQRAIDAGSRAGGTVFFPRPAMAYRITDTIQIPRPNLVLLGEGKVGYSEDSWGTTGYWGTTIYCDLPSGTAFNFDAGHLIHVGPRIENLAFIAANKSVSLVRIADFNSWTIRECLFRGSDVGIEIATSNDNAWSVVDNCSFYRNRLSMDIDGFGVEIRGGRFIATGSDVHIYCRPTSQHTRITNALFDRGRGIVCLGGHNHMTGLKFERCNPGIVIDGDRSVAPDSGKGNRILSCAFTQGGVGVAIHVKPGGRNTRIVAPDYYWVGTPLIDEGADTQVWP